MQGEAKTPVYCAQCARPVAMILHDGSVEIASRHNGVTHYTVIPAAALERLRKRHLTPTSAVV
jgi:hypothetical protein